MTEEACSGSSRAFGRGADFREANLTLIAKAQSLCFCHGKGKHLLSTQFSDLHAATQVGCNQKMCTCMAM